MKKVYRGLEYWKFELLFIGVIIGTAALLITVI